MKLHYGGIFKTDEDFKVQGKHHEGAVAFREPEVGAFAAIANAGSVVVLVGLIAVVFVIGKPDIHELFRSIWITSIVPLGMIVPHEFLHAICFREDVYLYFYPSKMLAFAYGTESMSRNRFVFMSMLPNIVFGIIPYVLFLVNPDWLLAGCIGAIGISAGLGDYINVCNAITQMPKGAKTYLHGYHSYWYMDSI